MHPENKAQAGIGTHPHGNKTKASVSKLTSNLEVLTVEDFLRAAAAIEARYRRGN